MNDCVDHLVFEVFLSTLTRSHLNATCIDFVNYMRSFIIKVLFNLIIAEVKGEVASMLFLTYYFFPFPHALSLRFVAFK